MIPDRDTIDKLWDRADFAASSAWREMDEFLKRLESDGPPKTAEEKQMYGTHFLEIQRRCVERSLEIHKRAASGDQAPHLSVIKP